MNFNDKELFEKVLSSLGFLEFFPFVNKFEHVAHFYAFFEGKIVHLHVYYKIVTGESNTKNYILPLEDLENISKSYSKGGKPKDKRKGEFKGDSEQKEKMHRRKYVRPLMNF